MQYQDLGSLHNCKLALFYLDDHISPMFINNSPPIFPVYFIQKHLYSVCMYRYLLAILISVFIIDMLTGKLAAYAYFNIHLNFSTTNFKVQYRS